MEKQKLQMIFPNKLVPPLDWCRTRVQPSSTAKFFSIWQQTLEFDFYLVTRQRNLLRISLCPFSINTEFFFSNFFVTIQLKNYLITGIIKPMYPKRTSQVKYVSRTKSAISEKKIKETDTGGICLVDYI